MRATCTPRLIILAIRRRYKGGNSNVSHSPSLAPETGFWLAATSDFEDIEGACDGATIPIRLVYRTSRMLAQHVLALET